SDHPERGANSRADAQPGGRGHARAEDRRLFGAGRGPGRARGRAATGRGRAAGARVTDRWTSTGPQSLAALPAAMLGGGYLLHDTRRKRNHRNKHVTTETVTNAPAD